MFTYYNHLGFNNPYYFVDNKGEFEVYKDFKSTINNYPKSKVIDPVAVIELLNKSYILSDRTMIKGIQCTPWMAKPNKTLNKWLYAQLPKHGEINLPEKEIATALFRKICDEIKSYIGSKKRIGILLSGGMDSRIVAGALDYMIKNNEISDLNVTGFTWGNEGTRDVVYAEKIALRLGWKWKHYSVTAIDLLNNIDETAIHGCEFSPIHLHAIPQIRDKNKDIDVFLAGSYGDSVGRAEYSGWKIRNVRGIDKNIANMSHFVLNEIYKTNVIQLYDDINRYHDLFPTKNKIARNEHDYQLHYMRRMLNPCMSLLIDENTGFHQIFTSPDVYGYIWGVSPNRRTDLIYKNMFDYFSTPLLDIPWARTGIMYGEKKGIPDKLPKEHHTYSKVIRDEIFDEIKDIIFHSEIFNLGIFNKSSINKIFLLEEKYPTNNLRYLEKLIWLASLSKMISIYDIYVPETTEQEQKKYDLTITIDYFSKAARKKIGPYLKKYCQSL